MTSLRESTKEKHNRAEKMPFNVRMFESLLTKEEYLLYLYQQRSIFETLEDKGVPHPSLLRKQSIHKDIEELESQVSHSGVTLPSTQKYIDYLQKLSYTDRLPHIYLNHMALLFGGQLMKSKVPSTGNMYDFNDVQDAIQSIRQVQLDEWADEVNRGYDFMIALFEELETITHGSQR